MAPRSRQVMLSCPSSLQGHSDFPTPVTPLLSVSSGLTGAYHSRNAVETLGSQVPHRYLSPHAIGYTPGPLQVLAPFTSLQALAFSKSRVDRRVVRHRRIYPSPGLSQLSLPGYRLRSCTIRFLATACGFGRHPWLGTTHAMHEPSRYRVGASSARMLPCEPAPSLLVYKGN